MPPPPQVSTIDLDLEDLTIPEGEFDEELLEMPDVSNIRSLPGFDKYAGRMWVYPTNYPVRSYQYSIVQSSLYKNTLVVLPTGLGKTFIAAVVMYNFYRWYPEVRLDANKYGETSVLRSR